MQTAMLLFAVSSSDDMFWRSFRSCRRAWLASRPVRHRIIGSGFRSSMIAGLVEKGLATITREKVWAGAKLIEVAKVRITAAGREALAES